MKKNSKNKLLNDSEKVDKIPPILLTDRNINDNINKNKLEIHSSQKIKLNKSYNKKMINKNSNNYILNQIIKKSLLNDLNKSSNSVSKNKLNIKLIKNSKIPLNLSRESNHEVLFKKYIYQKNSIINNSNKKYPMSTPYIKKSLSLNNIKKISKLNLSCSNNKNKNSNRSLCKKN